MGNVSLQLINGMLSFAVVLLAIAGVAADTPRPNEAQRQAVLDAHNAYRLEVASGQAQAKGQVLPKASNMMKMIYDTDMETSAYNYVKKCVWAHSSGDDRGGDAGENLYAVGAEVTDIEKLLTDATNSWYSEIKNYDTNVDSLNFTADTGHFTQVIWATSYKLACAAYYCPQAANLNGPQTLVACRYGPAGNYPGSRIYRRGCPATRCPYGTLKDGDLCAVDPNAGPRPDAQFVGTERQVILDALNGYRRKLANGEFVGQGGATLPQGSDIRQLVYDDDLSKTASDFLEQCKFAYPPGSSAYNAEILAHSGNPVVETAEGILQGWFNDGSKANASSVSSYAGGDIKNFALLAWAKSEKIGCAIKRCDDLGWTLFLCLVGDEKGRVQGQPIYQQGEACSNCPEGYTCNKGLCKK